LNFTGLRLSDVERIVHVTYEQADKYIEKYTFSSRNVTSRLPCSQKVWHKSIHFWRRYARKTTFYSQWPWPLDFKFAPLVTSSPMFSLQLIEIFLRFFLFRENRRHWQLADRQTGCNS